MSGKRVFLAGLVVMLLSLQAGRAQAPAPLPPTAPGMPAMAPPEGAPATAAANIAYTDLSGSNPDEPNGSAANARKPISEWLLYPRMPGCCGPIGANGPIGCEVFLRSGISFPIGGGILQHSLEDGWYIEGGGRALFFNPAQDRALTATLSVGNVFYPSRHDVPAFTLFRVPVKTVLPSNATSSPQAAATLASVAAQNGISASQAATLAATGTPISVTVPSLTASVASYNQTWFGFSGGYEWYLWGSADCSRKECNWRVGFEVGGQYASEKVDFNEIRHHTGTAGGVVLAMYSEVEVPWQCTIFNFGLRTQYDYIFTDILQQQNSNDLQSFNLLITAGLRF
jgi:hypothetical protein